MPKLSFLEIKKEDLPADMKNKKQGAGHKEINKETLLPDDPFFCQKAGDAGKLLFLLKEHQRLYNLPSLSPYSPLGRGIVSHFLEGKEEIDWWATEFMQEEYQDKGHLFLCHDGSSLIYDLMTSCFTPLGEELLTLFCRGMSVKVVYDPEKKIWTCFVAGKKKTWREVPFSCTKPRKHGKLCSCPLENS